MNDIQWFNVMDKCYFGNIYAVVQEGYVTDLEKRGDVIGSSWKKADKFRVQFRMILDGNAYFHTMYFSETLFHHIDIFKQRLDWWAGNLKTYMDKILTIKDFCWVVIDIKKHNGYFSFKDRGYEICLDYSLKNGWVVYLCNKFEEVLEEYCLKTECEAWDKVNDVYRSFVKCNYYGIK